MMPEAGAVCMDECSAVLAQLANQWQQSVGSESRRIVLCGAGRVGEMTLDWCRAHGIEPRCFVDNAPKRWGQKIGGIPIHAVTAVVYENPDDVFIVTVQRGNDLAKQLRGLAAQRVVHYHTLFHLFADHEGAERLSALWADQKSKNEYLAQLRYRLDGETATLPPYEPLEALYFAPEYTSDETVFDCGAYTGDTIEAWIERLGGFRQWIAYEPDPANYTALCETVALLEDVHATSVILRPIAVGGTIGRRPFIALGEMPSRIGANGNRLVDCTTIDANPISGSPPTVIKMDIEGAELEALQGGRQTIEQARPILAISAYHRPEDLWTIPTWIHELQAGYRLYLRRYGPRDTEMVVYGIPEGRAMLDGCYRTSSSVARSTGRSETKSSGSKPIIRRRTSAPVASSIP